MDVSFTLNGIAFEWDDDKASANVRKHGVVFGTACEAFFDPFSLSADAGVIEGEVREAIIGLTVNWHLLYVVYAMRENDVIRVISARPATVTERRLYEDR